MLGEIDGPFTGETVNGSLGSGVAGGASLPGNRQLAGYIHDAPLAGDKRVESEVSQVVEMEEIALERCHEFIGTGPEADPVIDSRIVNNAVKAAEGVEGLLDGVAAGFHLGQFRLDHEASSVSGADAGQQFPAGLRTAANDDRDGTLADKNLHRGGSDALGAAGDDHDLVFDLEVHGL